MFWDNLPWREEEGRLAVTDRTLATAILYNLCPGEEREQCGAYLAHCPDLKLSYPCNAVWRQWALARLGYSDVILKDLREKWAVMPSVKYNNAYQEHWIARTDSADEWSHIPQAPMLAILDVLLGIRPTKLAYQTFELCPQLADIGDFSATVHTVRGSVQFQAVSIAKRSYRIRVDYPREMQGQLKALPGMRVESLPLCETNGDLSLYALPSGVEFIIQYERK